MSFRNYSSKFPSLEKTLRKPKVEDNSRRTIIGIVSGSVQSMAMRELQAGVAAIFHFPVHIIPPLRFFPSIRSHIEGEDYGSRAGLALYRKVESFEQTEVVEVCRPGICKLLRSNHDGMPSGAVGACFILLEHWSLG